MAKRLGISLVASGKTRPPGVRPGQRKLCLEQSSRSGERRNDRALDEVLRRAGKLLALLRINGI
jgi:hypothetical protein